MRKAWIAGAALLALGGCGAGDPLRVERSICPALATLQWGSDITLFQPPGSFDADAIDVQASITNLRGGCTEAGDAVASTATFDVVAQRRSAAGAREVTLPFFASVVRAGDQIIAKQTGSVTLRFADGQLRATAPASIQARTSRAASTLPPEINDRITRERKPGDPDAALDPMADPLVRDAVRQASFELIVGFQLTEAQLLYNGTH